MQLQLHVMRLPLIITVSIIYYNTSSTGKKAHSMLTSSLLLLLGLCARGDVVSILKKTPLGLWPLFGRRTLLPLALGGDTALWLF